MTIKPILFNAEMVRAILDGRKTVTRRIVKPQPVGRIAYVTAGHRAGTWGYPGESVYKYWGDEYRIPQGLSQDERDHFWRPPYSSGDVLWVRETWSPYIPRDIIDGERFAYKASASAESEWFGRQMKYRWRPSIHMPREAARIWLRVMSVSVERLTSMRFTDLVDEGFASGSVCEHKKEIAALEFSELWDSTIKRADLALYGWAANPWVWRIEFERCEKPKGACDV